MPRLPPTAAGYHTSPFGDGAYSSLPQPLPFSGEFRSIPLNGPGFTREAHANWYARAADLEFVDQPETFFQGGMGVTTDPLLASHRPASMASGATESPGRPRGTILSGLLLPPEVLEAAGQLHPDSFHHSQREGRSSYPPSDVFYASAENNSSPKSPLQSRRQDNVSPPRTSSLFAQMTGGLLSDGTGSDYVSSSGLRGRALPSDPMGEIHAEIPFSDSMVVHTGWSNSSAVVGAPSETLASSGSAAPQAKLRMRELLRPASYVSVPAEESLPPAVARPMSSTGAPFHEELSSGATMPSYAHHAATFADIIHGSAAPTDLSLTPTHSHVPGSTSSTQPPSEMQVPSSNGILRPTTASMPTSPILPAWAAQVVEPAEEQVTQLIWEVIEEVPEIHKVQMQEERPVIEYQDVPKAVEKPIVEVVKRVVEKPVPWRKETLVEVPRVEYMDIVREVPRPRVQIVPKPVTKPVAEIVEREVPVPQVTVKEEIVEVPRLEDVEIYKEILLLEQREEVEKKVIIPEVRLEERLVEVEHIETHDRIVEVPEVEIHEIIKQVPKTEVVYVDREVPIPQIQYVEKLVEVPQVVYVEQPVEVPKIVKKEVIKHVPKPVIQYVDRPVPKHIMEYREVIEDVPVTLKEERIVEVPEIVHVETTTKVPRIEMRNVAKEVLRVKIEPQEVFQEVPAIVRQERAKEVRRTLAAETITEQVRPVSEYVDRQVPKVEIKVVEQVVEVPQVLRRETPISTPVVQVAEAMKQVPEEVVRQVQDGPPRNIDMQERLSSVQVQAAEFAPPPVHGSSGPPRYRRSLSPLPSSSVSTPARPPLRAKVIQTGSEAHSAPFRSSFGAPATSSAAAGFLSPQASLALGSSTGTHGRLGIGAGVGTFGEGFRSERIVGDDGRVLVREANWS